MQSTLNGYTAYINVPCLKGNVEDNASLDKDTSKMGDAVLRVLVCRAGDRNR